MDLSRLSEFAELRRSTKFRVFQGTVALATLAVIVRSVFRCTELKEGFDEKLANEEVTFMVLEGAMIVVAVGC
jgi:RTA1 like protein